MNLETVLIVIANMNSSKESKLAHIGILVPDNFPDTAIDQIHKELDTSGLYLEINKRKLGIWNALEWTVPTILVVYILKPYFESFLKELGKDHFEILKQWIKKFSNNTRSIQSIQMNAPQSTKKLNTSNTQSRVISLQFRTQNGRNLKFLFSPTSCDCN